MIRNLFNNALEGSIPPELGQMESLQHLWVYMRKNVQPHPSFYSNLEDNILTGSIPSELGNLSKLQSLYDGISFSFSFFLAVAWKEIYWVAPFPTN
jgi:hypothetical protein